MHLVCRLQEHAPTPPEEDEGRGTGKSSALPKDIVPLTMCLEGA